MAGNLENQAKDCLLKMQAILATSREVGIDADQAKGLLRMLTELQGECDAGVARLKQFVSVISNVDDVQVAEQKLAPLMKMIRGWLFRRRYWSKIMSFMGADADRLTLIRKLQRRCTSFRTLIFSERTFEAELLGEGEVEPNTDPKVQKLLLLFSQQLDEALFHKLFGALQIVQASSCKFLQDLEVAFDEWPFINCGRVIKMYFLNDRKGSSKVHPYQSYIDQYLATYEFSKEVQLKPSTKKSIAMAERLVGITLSECLQLPINRLSRYKIFLDDLINNTHKDHTDMKPLREAQQRLVRLVESTREITKMHRQEAAQKKKEAARKAGGGGESAAVEEASRKVDAAMAQLKEREFQVGVVMMETIMRRWQIDLLRPILRRWREHQVNEDQENKVAIWGKKLRTAHQIRAKWLSMRRWQNNACSRALATMFHRAQSDKVMDAAETALYTLDHDKNTKVAMLACEMSDAMQMQSVVRIASVLMQWRFYYAGISLRTWRECMLQDIAVSEYQRLNASAAAAAEMADEERKVTAQVRRSAMALQESQADEFRTVFNRTSQFSGIKFLGLIFKANQHLRAQRIVARWVMNRFTADSTALTQLAMKQAEAQRDYIKSQAQEALASRVLASVKKQWEKKLLVSAIASLKHKWSEDNVQAAMMLQLQQQQQEKMGAMSDTRMMWAFSLILAAVHKNDMKAMGKAMEALSRGTKNHLAMTSQHGAVRRKQKGMSMIIMSMIAIRWQRMPQQSRVTLWYQNMVHAKTQQDLVLTRAELLIQAGESVCRNIKRHWADTQLHRVVQLLKAAWQHYMVRRLLDGIATQDGVVQAVRRSKIVAGEKSSRTIFHRWSLSNRGKVIINWYSRKVLSRQSREASLRLFASIVARWHVSVLSATLWQWLFNYQIWQVGTALQAQRSVMSGNMEQALYERDAQYAAMVTSKDKEIVAHLQAAKWETMQLQETRNLLGLAYNARGLNSLSNVYRLWGTKYISRCMRKWTEAVFETKVWSAVDTMERHRAATNIKAGFVQLGAMFDHMQFQRYCRGFYRWVGMMPEQIAELHQLPIKPYKALGNRAVTSGVAASAAFRIYNAPAGVHARSASPERSTSPQDRNRAARRTRGEHADLFNGVDSFNRESSHPDSHHYQPDLYVRSDSYSRADPHASSSRSHMSPRHSPASPKSQLKIARETTAAQLDEMKLRTQAANKQSIYQKALGLLPRARV